MGYTYAYTVVMGAQCCGHVGSTSWSCSCGVYVVVIWAVCSDDVGSTLLSNLRCGFYIVVMRVLCCRHAGSASWPCGIYVLVCTSLINKPFPLPHLPLTGCFLFSPAFWVNERLLCVKNQQLLKYSHQNFSPQRILLFPTILMFTLHKKYNASNNQIYCVLLWELAQECWIDRLHLNRISGTEL